MTDFGRILPRLGPWALLTAALCLPCACGNSQEGPQKTEPSPNSRGPVRSALPSITPAHGFPAKVKSFTGTAALLPRAPGRILAGNASLLDTTLQLVGPDRVAALPSTAFIYSALRKDPGKWKTVPLLSNFEAEPVLAAEPDLVLIHAYQVGTTIDRIIEHDIPVIVFPVPVTWQDQLEVVTRLGRVFGEQQRAASFVAELNGRAKALQTAAARTGLKVLSYANYGAGGSTAGLGTTLQVMIELAGMRNAAAEAGFEGHPNIDYEQLLAIDPDFFLVSLPSENAGSAAESVLCQEPLLAGLRAIREKRFLRLPEPLFSTASHELLSAAEIIAAQADGLAAPK